MKKLLALLLMAGVVAEVSARGCCPKTCEPECTYGPKPICEKTVTKVIRRPAIAKKRCHVEYSCPTDCSETGIENQ